ncbi:AMP-binding enzyme family protein [Mycobacterium xenopi 3993]|nr:AMP-binding enzyme family protein [Mycobacterium xenopi 3993]
MRGLIEVGVRQGDHVGVLMETRPSALVAIAALSRLGAVAVLMQPDSDLVAEARIGGVSEIIADPTNLDTARQLPGHVLVLGGGESRDLHLPEDADVIDMEKIDPDAVELPAWYRQNPGLARDLAFIGFTTTASGELVAKQITNYRWALSAFGTASTAALGQGDTVYCLTPLHHESGLLVSLGARWWAAPVSRCRAGCARTGSSPRSGSTGHRGVLYLGDVARGCRRPGICLARQPPCAAVHRLGDANGLVAARHRRLRPAHVVEFFATTDGQAVLANVSGAKIGSKGRPLPGAGHVELGAYDAEHDLILENDRGFVQVADTDEVGVLLAQPRGPIDPSASVKRGVFAPADTWISTEYLFRRDADGDYWLVGRRGSVIRTARGIVYCEPITDALGFINGSTSP